MSRGIFSRYVLRTTTEIRISPNTDVNVYFHNTLTEADIYNAEVGGTPLVQPIQADPNGRVQFWAEQDCYDVKFVYNGIERWEYAVNIWNIATTLAGLDSSQFLRSDVDDTFSGSLLTIANALDVGGALTAASYGGILEANLLDKTAAETVSGVWNFTGSTTDNLPEGSNLYYTQARFDSAFSAKTTTNLSEGTNLYFTNERVDDRVAALLVAGNLIDLTYDDVANTLTVAVQEGSGSGLDADTLDTLDSAQFVRSDVDDVVSGVLAFNNLNGGVLLQNSVDPTRELMIGQHGGSAQFLRFVPRVSGTPHFLKELAYDFVNEEWVVDGGFRSYDDLNIDTQGFIAGNRILTVADEGTLDAGTVDGIDSTSFLRSDAADSFSGILTSTGAGKIHLGGQILTSTAHLQVNGFMRTGNILLHEGGNNPTTLNGVLSNTAGNVFWEGQQLFHDGYHPNADKWTTARTLTVGATGKTVDGAANVSWSLAEIGALGVNDKAADSELLDGVNSTQFLRRDLANQNHRWDRNFSGQSGAAYTLNGSDYAGLNSLNNLSLGTWFGFSIHPTLSGQPVAQDTPAFSVNARNGQVYAFGEMYASSNQRVFADNYHPNADKWTTARTLTLGGDLSGNVAFDGSANFTLTATVANDSHTHSFDNLTGKTAGTGDYSTTGDLVAGRGSGSIALTINDGKGNSNVTFNHQNGFPDQNGNAGRIEVNTDATSGAYMHFELLSSVTSGVSTDLTGVLQLYEGYINAPQGDIREGGVSLSSKYLGISAKAADSNLLDNLDSTFFRNASNLNAGTLPAARFNDTAHGSRGGGSLHSVATTGANGFMSAADKAKLDGIQGGATTEPYIVASGTLSSATSVDFTIATLQSAAPFAAKRFEIRLNNIRLSNNADLWVRCRSANSNASFSAANTDHFTVVSGGVSGGTSFATGANSTHSIVVGSNMQNFAAFGNPASVRIMLENPESTLGRKGLSAEAAYVEFVNGAITTLQATGVWVGGGLDEVLSAIRLLPSAGNISCDYSIVAWSH